MLLNNIFIIVVISSGFIAAIIVVDYIWNSVKNIDVKNVFSRFFDKFFDIIKIII